MMMDEWIKEREEKEKKEELREIICILKDEWGNSFMYERIMWGMGV